MRKLEDTQSYKLSFKGENVYIGLDVHLKQWHICVRTRHISKKPFSQPADAGALRAYLDREFPEATYHSAYECGFSGFSAHRELLKHGIDNIVFHAADISDSQKERMRKTDAVDCVKICRNLMEGGLTAIFVPDETVESHRELLSQRNRLVTARTRLKNRLKSSLHRHGIGYPEEFKSATRHWSRAFLGWMEEEVAPRLAPVSGDIMLDNISELRHVSDLVKKADRDILTKLLPRYKEMDGLIRSIPGIGRLNSAAICAYVVDINRFESDDHLAGYVGLVPDVRASDDKKTTLGITVRGNRMLRSLLIESAWRAVALDPAMGMVFTNYKKRGLKSNNARIRIARKLVNRIRYVLRTGNKYENGSLK